MTAVEDGCGGHHDDLTGRACEIDSEKQKGTAELTNTAEVHNMQTQRLVIPGIVKNGLVVPQHDTPLPEGTHVDILMGPAKMTPELQAELAQWEKVNDEAWTMINQRDAEDR